MHWIKSSKVHKNCNELHLTVCICASQIYSDNCCTLSCQASGFLPSYRTGHNYFVSKVDSDHSALDAHRRLHSYGHPLKNMNQFCQDIFKVFTIKFNTAIWIEILINTISAHPMGDLSQNPSILRKEWTKI